MASVPLTFIPPDDENIVALRIYEAPAAIGPYIQIERTTVVGTFPDYINHYTTTAATNATDWFAIQWEDADGILGEMSQGIKGGERTLVGEVVKRVLERDPNIEIHIAVQEAEAAIQQVFGDGVDPYDIGLLDTTSFRKIQGLVYLVMARSYISRSVTLVSGNVQSATMGLISFKSGTTATQMTKEVQALIDMANKELGISTSYVMLMEDIEQATYITYDHSRLVSGWVSIE